MKRPYPPSPGVTPLARRIGLRESLPDIVCLTFMYTRLFWVGRIILTEIRKFDVSLLIQQHVIQLQIPIDDIITM